MTLSQAYCDKREAQLREWKARLDQLRAKADRARAEAKIELYRQLHALQAQYDAVTQKLATAREASGDAWDEMKAGFENAWADLKRAFDRSAAKTS